MDTRLGFSKIRLENSPDLDKTAFLGALGMLKLGLRNVRPASETRQIKNQKENGANTNGRSRFLSNLGEKFSRQIKIIFEDDNV